MNPQTTFVDPLLTDVYVGYSNTELIADILFPKVAVQKESGIYFVADKSNLIVPGSTKRALNGSANRITGKLTTDTYTLEEHSLEEWIDDRILKQYQDPFDPRSSATKRIAGQLQIEKENELISILAAATAGSNSVDVAGAWATTTTDIRAALATAKNTIHKATGVRPNTLVIDRLTYDAIIANTIFGSAIAYTSNKTEANMRAIMAEYFDLKQVLIAGGIKQSAAESGTGSFLWGGTKGIAYLMYIAETPAIEEPSAGYQFYMPEMTNVDVRREEGKKSDVIRATDFYVFKSVVSDAMFRLYDTIQT